MKEGPTNDLRNITQKINYPTTRTPPKPGVELMCSGRVSSSCSTYGTHHVTLTTNPVISHDSGNDRIMNKKNGKYPRLCDTYIPYELTRSWWRQ